MAQVRRSRGVSLSTGGLAKVDAALKKVSEGKRLTRDARAELMGIGKATSLRLLNREPVDKTTIQIAFRRLGLELENDDFEADYYGDDVCEEAFQIENKEPAARHKLLAIGTVLLLMVASLVAMGAILKRDHDAEKAHLGFGYVLRAALENYNKGDYRRATEDVSVAYAILNEFGSDMDRFLCTRLSADIAAAQGNLNSSIEQNRAAIKILVKLKDTEHIPAVREAIGEAQTKLGNTVEARKELLECKRGYEATRDSAGRAMAERDLISVEYKEGHYNEALVWAQKALSEVKGADQIGIEMDIYGRQSLALSRLGRTAEAEELLERTWDYWNKQDHPRWRALTWYQMGSVKLDEQKFDEAKKLLENSRSAYLTLGDKAGVSACDYELGHIK